MSNKIKQAKLLAQFIHEGQLRQDGEDYINHCERVAIEIYSLLFSKMGKEKKEDFPNKDETNMICAAWLHDILEDGKDYDSLNMLIFIYFGSDIHHLVHILTHNKKDTYIQYIEKVSRNPEALQIKWIDMWDNCSYHIPSKQELKYKNACLYLQSKGIEVPNRLKERLKI